MGLTIHDSIDDIAAAEWNRLVDTAYPFVRHEFLAALEHHGCVGEAFGWRPRHLALRDATGRLNAAAPMYIKDNSYGEFVFDWSWADAYERARLAYYPKLVAAVPYTPATGPRLLVAPEAPEPETMDELISGAIECARDLRVSSLHWLFTPDDETRHLETHGLMRRMGCQFHWENRGYRDFEDFLQTFNAHKRKKLKRERRRVHETSLALEVVHGSEASPEQLRTAEYFYRSTFDRKWGVATLNLPFFEEIARTMGEQLVLIFAREDSRYIAGAICFRSDDTLYGRHWGCMADYHSLHFEVCYYQGIDYCIRHGLKRFEPGAQGEHKVSRGFVPTPTWSAHWIAHRQFEHAIGDFLRRERMGVHHYMEELREHLPYRRGNANPGR